MAKNIVAEYGKHACPYCKSRVTLTGYKHRKDYVKCGACRRVFYAKYALILYKGYLNPATALVQGQAGNEKSLVHALTAFP